MTGEDSGLDCVKRRGGDPKEAFSSRDSGLSPSIEVFVLVVPATFSSLGLQALILLLVVQVDWLEPTHSGIATSSISSHRHAKQIDSAPRFQSSISSAEDS